MAIACTPRTFLPKFTGKVEEVIDWLHAGDIVVLYAPDQVFTFHKENVPWDVSEHILRKIRVIWIDLHDRRDLLALSKWPARIKQAGIGPCNCSLTLSAVFGERIPHFYRFCIQRPPLLLRKPLKEELKGAKLLEAEYHGWQAQKEEPNRDTPG